MTNSIFLRIDEFVERWGVKGSAQARSRTRRVFVRNIALPTVTLHHFAGQSTSEAPSADMMITTINKNCKPNCDTSVPYYKVAISMIVTHLTRPMSMSLALSYNVLDAGCRQCARHRLSRRMIDGSINRWYYLVWRVHKDVYQEGLGHMFGAVRLVSSVTEARRRRTTTVVTAARAQLLSCATCDYHV